MYGTKKLTHCQQEFLADLDSLGQGDIPSVTLPTQIQVIALEAEKGHDLLVGFNKLLRQSCLIRDCDISLGVASTDRLLNPQDIRQVAPIERVWNWFCKLVSTANLALTPRHRGKPTVSAILPSCLSAASYRRECTQVSRLPQEDAVLA